MRTGTYKIFSANKRYVSYKFPFKLIPRLPLFLRGSLFGLEIAVLSSNTDIFICDRLSFKFIASGVHIISLYRIIHRCREHENSHMNLECFDFEQVSYGAFIVGFVLPNGYYEPRLYKECCCTVY
jgi:hypothetical protein